jgi:hypothetical protein
MKESINPFKYLWGLACRFFLAILFGVIIDVVFSFVWMYVSGTNILVHFKEIYASNSAYLSHNPIVEHYVWHWMQTYGMQPLIDLANSLQGSYCQVASILIFAIFVVLQRAVIVIVSLPLYLVCIAVGMFDGLIGRELRRYQGGVESIRRDYFMRWIKVIEYIAFTGYMVLPIFINPVLWFFAFGALVACIHRMAVTYLQKYM